MEYISGTDSGAAVICKYDGIVEHVEAHEIGFVALKQLMVKK